MTDFYLTIRENTQALLKEKSSKFYAYAFPVSSETEVDGKLKLLKKEHPKSRHHCFAYIIGADKQLFRANDDGEPSGTAGKPILGQIEKRSLTNTLIVVVRYFGGTKLGTSGLIRAYKEAASLALEQTVIIEELLKGKLIISCSFEQIGNMMNIISSKGLDIVNVDYASNVKIELAIRLSEIENVITYVKAKILNRSIEDITIDTKIDDIAFTIESL